MKLLKEQGITIHTNFLFICLGLVGLLWATHQLDKRVVQKNKNKK